MFEISELGKIRQICQNEIHDYRELQYFFRDDNENELDMEYFREQITQLKEIIKKVNKLVESIKNDKNIKT